MGTGAATIETGKQARQKSSCWLEINAGEGGFRLFRKVYNGRKVVISTNHNKGNMGLTKGKSIPHC